MQKKRSKIEFQLAIKTQEQEFALSQQKIKERAQLEQVRLEEEAAIAVAKATAIEDELGISDHQDIGLPIESPNLRVKQYLDNHCEPEPTDVEDQPLEASGRRSQPSHHAPAQVQSEPSINARLISSRGDCVNRM